MYSRLRKRDPGWAAPVSSPHFLHVMSRDHFGGFQFYALELFLRVIV